MTIFHEVRADFDRETIVVYQAYRNSIADAALAAGKFVAPFSFGRMTWIKPSFLWLMERSNWGRKPDQERILAVRIRRSGWDKALSEAVLTSFVPRVHHTFAEWQTKFELTRVHVQWDPERSIHGKKLEFRSIQVGLSRKIISEYVDDWIVEIEDITPTVHKIRRHCDEGNMQRAKDLLPQEARYPVAASALLRLDMHGV
jgi:hypothetical protein